MSTGRASVQCSIIMLDGPAEKIQTNKQHTAMWITLREKFLFLIDFKVHWRVGQFRYPGLKTAFPVNIKNMADNTLESSLALRPVHKHMHIHGNIYQPHLNLLNIVLVVCFRSSVVFYWAQKNIAKCLAFPRWPHRTKQKKKYCKTEKPPKTRQKYLWSTHTHSVHALRTLNTQNWTTLHQQLGGPQSPFRIFAFNQKFYFATDWQNVSHLSNTQL